jgi:hypothetical protein
MLPERINVMKVVSYDVNRVVVDIREMKEDALYTPTIDEVVDWMTEWVLEDFDVVDCNNLIFQDENGEEL